MKLFFLLLFTYFVECEEPEKLMYPEPQGGWLYDSCISTTAQSPIDINPVIKNSIIVDKNHDYAIILSMDYSAIKGTAVKFNGKHSWITGDLDAGSIKLMLNGKEYNYKLKQIHFHLYSEHRLNSTQYPMEMHIVHKNEDTSDKDNENLVLGVLFDYQKDKENDFLKDMKFAKEENIDNAELKNIINENDPFFYYKGGLTTPPCTENVNWIVFRKIRQMSISQFNDLKEWVTKSDETYYNNGYGNARTIKPTNERKIYLENDENDENGVLYLAISFIYILLFLVLLI